MVGLQTMREIDVSRKVRMNERDIERVREKREK